MQGDPSIAGSLTDNIDGFISIHAPMEVQLFKVGLMIYLLYFIYFEEAFTRHSLHDNYIGKSSHLPYLYV